MRVRLDQELRALSTQLRSSVFWEVIRAAAVINSPIISMTFDKEGLILAFFPNRWKIRFLYILLSKIYFHKKPELIVMGLVLKSLNFCSATKYSKVQHEICLT